MAERDYIINARVNTGNSAKDLQDVNKAAQGVQQTTEKGAKSSDDYAKRLDDIKKQAQQGGHSIRDMSKIIQQYQAIAVEAGASSPIGRQAIAEAAVLRDRIDEVSQATRRLADDGANVRAALQLGTGVVQGYQGVLGVTTLLGVENENLIETLTKLQAAQGVVNSLSAIQQALAKESVLVLKAQALGTSALSAAQGAYAAIVGTSTGALKLFRLALIGTGIGAIVVLLGSLIANFESVKNVVLDVMSVALLPFKRILQAIGLVESDEEKERKQRHSAELQRRKEAAQAAQKEATAKINALKREREAVEGRYDFEIRKAKAAGEETREEERKKRLFVLRSIRDQVLAIDELIEARIMELRLIYGVNEAQAEQFKVVQDLRAEQKRLRDTFVSTVQDMEVADIEYNTQRKNEAKKTADELKKQREKEAEDARQANLKRLADESQMRSAMLAEISRLEDEYLNSQLDKQQQEINAVYDKYFAILEAAREAGEDTQLLEEAQLNALNEIRMKYAKIEQDEKDRLAQEDKDRLKEQQEAEIEYLNFRLDASKSTFDTLSSLANTFAGQTERGQKRAFNAQKALGVAQGLVSTYQSAINAYASQLIPGDVTSVIRAKVAAATAAAAGLANVANIAKQQFNPQGGGSASGASPATGGEVGLANPQQQIQLFGQANEGSEIFAQNATAQATNITVTAQVVETDMTSTQNEVQGIQQLATL
jgi:hypothetical protein